MLASARRHTDPRLDLTYVFYAREEVAAVHGLGELFDERPTCWSAMSLSSANRPTARSSRLPGFVAVRLTLAGRRAHTARA